MQLEKQFLIYTMRSFALLVGVFFPILYLSDFLFSEGFQAIYALAKLPFRYGQSLASLLLWAVWMAVRSMRKRYTDTSFIIMGFRPKDAWKLILILTSAFIILDALVLIPSNHLFLPEQIQKTNWSIKAINCNAFGGGGCGRGGKKLVLLNKVGNNVELWQAADTIGFANGVMKGDIAYIQMKTNSSQKFVPADAGQERIMPERIGREKTFANTSLVKARVNYANCNEDIKEDILKIRLNENDFFILWNEPKKLSWSGLKNYENYLNYHKLDTADVKIQLHIFLSRVALLLPMVVCGFALGWRNGVSAMIACCIFSNWLNQIVIFMPLSSAILCVWGNVLFWLLIGLRYLRR